MRLRLFPHVPQGDDHAAADSTASSLVESRWSYRRAGMLQAVPDPEAARQPD